MSARSKKQETEAPPRADLPRRVLKFGGTSVTGASRVDVIARVVRDRMERTHPVVVVSAMSGVTETLRRASELATRGESADLLREIESKHRQAVAEVTGNRPDVAEAVERLLAEHAPRCGTRGSARRDAELLHHDERHAPHRA